MKRKIIYLVLVVVFTILVVIFGNGCSSGDQALQETGAPEGPAVSEVKATPAALGENTEQPSEKEEAESALAEQETVTISINCLTIKDYLNQFDQAKLGILPEDGLIVPETQVEISEGDTVFDVLLAVTKDKKIHMEYVSTPLYSSNYIEGIGNIYEIDAGPLSGWMYKVNGEFPSYGCGRYVVEAGDRIEWVYTCDLGRDIGGDWNEQNQ